jgi:ribonuclease HII
MVGVVVRPGFPVPPAGLTDSKRLTAKRRQALAGLLPGRVEAHATGQASHEETGALGMTAALRRAAARALESRL